tara:strand:+ start:291 stop:476 length:186 start_codon:yes stop_codon:yes gene_type:complete
MNIFWKAKRRLRNEFKGLKYLMSGEKTQTALKSASVVYEAIKIMYNPFYVLDLSRRLILNL